MSELEKFKRNKNNDPILWPTAKKDVNFGAVDFLL